ncbi:MAG: hypothetical protein RLZZ156_1378, partial [Deinococcota bacterium]
LISTKTIFLIFFIVFIVLYPNLYYPIINPLISWSLPRISLLFIAFIFTILALKTIKMPKKLLFFVVINILLSSIQFLNPLEDERIFTILGVDDRFDGSIYQILVAILMIFSYYCIKILNENTKVFLYFSLGFAGVIQSIVLIHQYTWIPLNLFFTEINFRFDLPMGLTGHAGYTAGLLIPLIILSIYTTQSKNYVLSTLSYVFAPIICFGLNLTQNRSSLIAVSIVLIIWIFLSLRDLKKIGLLAFCVVLINFSANILPVNPTLTRDFTNPQTLSTRLEIWNFSIALLPKSWGFPLLGGGTGNLKLQIAEQLPIEQLMPFYEREYGWQSSNNIKKITSLNDKNSLKRQRMYLVTYKDGELRPVRLTLDRAHNFFLDKAFSIGLIGAILWIIFYVYPIFAYFRLKPYQKTFEQQTLSMALIAIQIYYIFWFSVMQVEPIHVVVALMAWVGIERAKATPDPHQKSAAPLKDTAPALNT